MNFVSHRFQKRQEEILPFFVSDRSNHKKTGDPEITVDIFDKIVYNSIQNLFIKPMGFLGHPSFHIDIDAEDSA